MSKAKLRAEAINRFVTDAKAQGVYDSLKAACILTGWDTLAGALTPLVGAAPTNVGGAFTAADYDRGGQGLKGDGSSKYLNSNRADNADPSGSKHYSCYATTPPSLVIAGLSVGGLPSQIYAASGNTAYYLRSGNGSNLAVSGGAVSGFHGMKRADSSTVHVTYPGGSNSFASPESVQAIAAYVFARNNNGTTDLYSSTRLSWYSIGSSVDLSALDTLVTRLMSDLRAIEEDGMDRDALAYCRAVEAQDGSFMVTGVKQAVDRLVKGLKYDRDANGRSAWDAIGASCLLCGPRTIAGALVPLKGVAPTAQGGWTSSDYNQETGLKGNGSTLYLDSNRAYRADDRADMHAATYVTANPTLTNKYVIGAKSSNTDLVTAGYAFYGGTSSFAGVGDPIGVGLHAVARATTSTAQYVKASSLPTNFGGALGTAGAANPNYYVFGYSNEVDAITAATDARLAFYSIGASLSLSSLDSRITKYVSDVAAAIP